MVFFFFFFRFASILRTTVPCFVQSGITIFYEHGRSEIYENEILPSTSPRRRSCWSTTRRYLIRVRLARCISDDEYFPFIKTNNIYPPRVAAPGGALLFPCPFFSSAPFPITNLFVSLRRPVRIIFLLVWSRFGRAYSIIIIIIIVYRARTQQDAQYLL